MQSADNAENSPVVQIDTYLADLDDPCFADARFLDCVAQDERRRAEDFCRARDARLYLARRAILRHLLAAQTTREAGELEFSYNNFGKPALVGEGPCFNVSRAGNLAFYTICEREIGCDIEWHRPELAKPSIAAHFFSPIEQSSLCRAADGDWIACFFNCWTRKEAVVKAMGFGLSYPADSFSVSVDSDGPAEVLHGLAGWRIDAPSILPALHAAIAVKAARAERLEYRPLHLPGVRPLDVAAA